MGRHPTSFEPGPSDLADWNKKSHVVIGLPVLATAIDLVVNSSAGSHEWFKDRARGTTSARPKVQLGRTLGQSAHVIRTALDGGLLTRATMTLGP